MNIIQNGIFPKISLCSEKELYFRYNDFVQLDINEQIFYIEKMGKIRTDTYFNSISIGKWKKYTNIDSLYFSIKFKGKIKIEWFVNRLKFSSRIFKSVILESDSLSEHTIPLEFWDELEDGMLAFDIYGLDYSSIESFNYKTKTKTNHEIKLGIVITHFNRQQHVLPALERLKEELFNDNQIKEKITLNVVDNSQNLPNVKMVKIIPNKNLGGSGGFTRGLIDLKKQGNYTHCLFMDDDATCEVEGIKRTIALLEYAKDPELSIGGAMLREDNMYLQYENGGKFSSLLTPLKPNLDLRNYQNLLLNEVEEKIDFCGWWYFAFPLSKVKYHAFPFFVRGDDIGFGLAHKFHIITLNGISSWQGDFALKHGPQTAYLDTRHQLMQHFHHFSHEGLLKLIEVSARMTLRNLFTYHYDTALATIIALEDIQKGKSFWIENVDMSAKRKEISDIIFSEKPYEIPIDIRDSAEQGNPKENKILRIFRWMTLNGHLLPNFLLKKSIVLQPKGYGGRLREIYRYNKVLYIHAQTNTGFVLEHDKSKFFSYTFRYFKAIYNLAKNYKALKKEYQDSYDELTSLEFWEKQFKQDQ